MQLALVVNGRVTDRVDTNNPAGYPGYIPCPQEVGIQWSYNGALFLDTPEAAALRAAQTTAVDAENARRDGVRRNALAVSIYRDICEAASEDGMELLIRVVDQLVNRQSNPTAAMTTFRTRWQSAKDQASTAVLAARRL